MRLSEVRGGRQRQQQDSHPEQLGVIRQATTFTRPIEALYDGRPVVLIATGDIVGMSPAVQFVDENGKLDWVSTDDVVITQREFLPQSEQTRNRLRQQTGSTYSSPQQ
jgi:hypothetical protein